MSVRYIRSNIEQGLSSYAVMLNGRRPSEHILPEFDQFLRSLLWRTKNLPIVQDADLRERVKRSSLIPVGILASKMKQKSYILVSENEVKEICDGRVEFVSLMQFALWKFTNSKRSGSFPSLKSFFAIT